jgi:alginate O-acetyltransferase complex protein AlgI
MSSEPFIPIVYFGLINIALILFGYLILKRRLLITAWLIMMLSILGVNLIFANEHPIMRMLAIIVTTFTAMKAIAAIKSYRDKQITLTFIQWAAFAGGWAGMRPQPFETLGARALPDAWLKVLFGLSRIITGLLLIALAYLLATLTIVNEIKYLLISAILLVAFSLILHFGLLSIGAGMWRFFGVNTYYLFRKPATAMSLTEFWSKRWNLAFSEMTSVAVFRPFKNRIGAGVALMASFIFSGLLHELAISLPVNHGYGLPTFYFIIQGLLVLIEKILVSHGATFLKNKFAARLWLFFWLVVPMPLLFHAHFIREIVWPLAGLRF